MYVLVLAFSVNVTLLDMPLGNVHGCVCMHVHVFVCVFFPCQAISFIFLPFAETIKGQEIKVPPSIPFLGKPQN